MNGIKAFNYTCQGESHKSTDKPCQDSSFARSQRAYAVAIVSDGHGGARYFRSDKGSEIAVNITKKAIERFVAEPRTLSLLGGVDFQEFGIDPQLDYSRKEIYNALNWLTSSIIAQWHKEILSHALKTPLTEWELNHLDEKYLDEFNCAVQNEGASLEKIYGCTLMAYVQTDRFWFAFQIGDGKAVFFDTNDGDLKATQPIPWDERCFLNKTTSICDSEASKEFRYCCCGNGNFPDAVFLGSDGIDDTYGDGDKLTDFYIRLYKEIVSTSQNKAEKVLQRDLPEISKIGSKDDMSIACVYNSNQGRKLQIFLLMSQWQISKLHNRTNELENKIHLLKSKIEAVSEPEILTEAQRIEHQYAQNDLRRAQDEKDKLENDVTNIINEDRKLREKHNM